MCIIAVKYHVCSLNTAVHPIILFLTVAAPHSLFSFKLKHSTLFAVLCFTYPTYLMSCSTQGIDALIKVVYHCNICKIWKTFASIQLLLQVVQEKTGVF